MNVLDALAAIRDLPHTPGNEFAELVEAKRIARAILAERGSAAPDSPSVHLTESDSTAAQRPAGEGRVLCDDECVTHCQTPCMTEQAKTRALTDRLNLANLRRVMTEWHEASIALGYDGVPGALAELSLTKARQ